VSGLLHMTKVAYGQTSLAMLVDTIERRAENGEVIMTTRNLPKRQLEILAGGSLYWIIKHQLVARATIMRFQDAAEGRHDIVLRATVIPVRPLSRRAHQGWRYLEGADAPLDLADGDMTGDALPPKLIGDLADLHLI
jgi:hypothetical protein